MNLRTAITRLALSGVFLFGTTLWLATRNRGAGAAPAAGGAAATAAMPEPTTAAATPGVEGVPFDAFDWARLATNDLRVYIRNLRGVQCPEQTVRDIIIAEVNREFAPREAPFKATGEVVVPDNETSAQRSARRKADYQRRRSLRLVEREKVAVIRDLLGIELPLEPLRGWYSRSYERMESAIDGVPADKRERVRETMEAYWELSDSSNDQRELDGNGRDAEFIERYKENNERRRLALSQILTPDELEIFEMRGSSVADRLRTQLAEMQPTEAEFREIYRMRREIEEPYGGTMTVGTVAGAQQDPGAEKRYRERLESLLPPERLAQFDRVQDSLFQNLARLRDRFDLPPEVMDRAYEILREGMPVTDHLKVVQDGQVVDREVIRRSSRPAAEQWNLIREMIGPQAFSVLEATVPDDSAPRTINRVRGVPPVPTGRR